MELSFTEMWKTEGGSLWDKCYEISFEYSKIRCILDI